ncbi:anti-sigma factor [Actinokineospora terrae]|uniref:Regulator of SigK n=1 Tax=Actinokineospora terrae TaxID=155974 RepID=A0A1H9QH19_9PSEU|nr:anti-sigma factor [Actinokineospora terrae]SER59149.1 Anti-sigma-K factor RskA [Actinokineospora terrae]
MTADIHALTGAYALDAIPEIERAAFERHLADCDACAQEVRELQATAARLGDAAAEAPPAELKARVLARIAEVRQLPPIEHTGPAARRARPWATRLTAVAAAALLVVSVSLGALLLRSQQELDDQKTQAAAMTELLSADDARFVSGSTTSGLAGTVVVSRSRGQVMLLAANMPPAPDGKTYQAWLMQDDGSPRSVGLLRPDDTGRASIVDSSGIGTANQVGVSIEAAGGSDTPHGQVVMKMALPD